MQTQEPSSAKIGSQSPATAFMQECQALVRPWWDATLLVLPTFLATRFLLLVLTYFGGVLFTVTTPSPFALTFQTVLYKWYHWDAARILTIATQGYLEQSNTGFFPLYPALIHTIYAPLHLDPLITGILISNLAFLGVLIVFFRLVSTEFDAATARRSTLYIAIFPTSLVFFTAYSTSLFLLFTLLCFYLLRQGSWGLAAIFGGLAAQTEMPGVLLFVIFVCEFFRQNKDQLRSVWQKQPVQSALLLASQLISGLLIPLGTVLYMYTLARKFQDAWAFLRPQGTTTLSAPWHAPLTALTNILHQSLYTFTVAHSIFELTLLAMLLLIFVLCYIGPERLTQGQWTFPLFGLLLLFFTLFFPTLPNAIPIAYDPLPGLQYVALEIFIAFVMLARLGRREWFHKGYLLIALPLLTFMLLQLFTANWNI